MTQITRNKAVEFAKIGIILIILLFSLNFLLPVINSEKTKIFIEDIGYVGPIVLILYIIFSHVFAPISGSPGALLGFALYGVIRMSIYLYIASMISAAINYMIAQKYGRIWVAKLVGKSTMNEVDYFANTFGTKLLIVSRIFGFSIFEVISYAAGFTPISFRKYMLITFIFNLPSAIIFAIIFRSVDFSSPWGILYWIVPIALTGLVFTIMVKKYATKRIKDKF